MAGFAGPLQANPTFSVNNVTRLDGLRFPVQEEIRLNGEGANEKSRLNLQIMLAFTVWGNLQAAGAFNCLALLDLCKRYLLPKIM
jgi:hypothetical protein